MAPEASPGLELVTEAQLSEVLADEEAVAELQSILSLDGTVVGSPAQEPNQGPLSAPANPELDSDMTLVQEAVDSTPQEQRGEGQLQAASHSSAERVLERARTHRLNEDQQRQGQHGEGTQLTVAQQQATSEGGNTLQEEPTPTEATPAHVWPQLPVGPYFHNSPAGSLGHFQSSMTPEQHALHVALSLFRVAQTDTQVFKVVRTLAVALGASRTEAGTIKALHAVLLQLVRPAMSDAEAHTSTGASRSNFTKWKRRVLHAQSLAGSPDPSRSPSSLASP